MLTTASYIANSYPLHYNWLHAWMHVYMEHLLKGGKIHVYL